MPVDRYALLEWIAQWEEDNPGQALDGLGLMMGAAGLAGSDGRPWPAVVATCGALRRLGWIDWAYHATMGGSMLEPPQPLMTETDFQRVHDVVVTGEGHTVVAGRRQATGGTQINIVNSTVGQLALGDITHFDLRVLLDAIETSLESVEATPEVKAEGRQTIARMRDAAQSIATTAAGEALGVALRRALGL